MTAKAVYLFQGQELTVTVEPSDSHWTGFCRICQIHGLDPPLRNECVAIVNGVETDWSKSLSRKDDTAITVRTEAEEVTAANQAEVPVVTVEEIVIAG